LLALSTAWFKRDDPTIGATLRAIAAMGFGAVEIGISKARFDLAKVQKALKTVPLKVASVHNVCARRAPALENERGDWLASPDPKQRRQAIALTVESAENAKAMGCGVVVLHLGIIPIEQRWEKQSLLYKLGEGGPAAAVEYGVTIQDVLDERHALAAPYFDAACQSLAKLLEATSGVRFGLECRMGWHELPSLDEVGKLLERFRDPRVGYWHDTGHAVLQESMGIAGQFEWLRRYGHRTFGAHLHDVTERTRDHYPPGLGTVDFEALLGLLPRDALRVMEIGSGFLPEEIVLGKRRLEEMGF
jgi:sugar phosphate isomerase/epimerase